MPPVGGVERQKGVFWGVERPLERLFDKSCVVGEVEFVVRTGSRAVKFRFEDKKAVPEERFVPC